MRIDRHAPNRFRPTPDSASYRTRPGDTLRRIAERLGIRLADLAAVNPHVGSADAPLTPDQVLRLPTPQAPSVASRNPSPTSFRVEYERAHPNVFQRLAGPSPLGRPSDADPWLTALERTLSQEASGLKLIKALKDFLIAAGVVRDPTDRSPADPAAARIEPMFQKLCEEALKIRAQENLPARIDALAKFVQGLDSNYRRYRGAFKLPPDMAMGLAVVMTIFQSRMNSILMEVLKDAYPQYFSKVSPSPLAWAEAALDFSGKVLGLHVPPTAKDILKIMKYMPSGVVASMVGDTVKLVGDLLPALWCSAVGDPSLWNQVFRNMVYQEYGPVYQGLACIADWFITGGKNVETIPPDRVLLKELVDILLPPDPGYLATPQWDRFLRTLREPVLLYALYMTRQLNPGDVADQLLMDIGMNGVRVHFAHQVREALRYLCAGVERGDLSYEDWRKFQEVVTAVVTAVWDRLSSRLSPGIRITPDAGIDYRALSELVNEIKMTDTWLQEMEERRRIALETLGG